MIVGLGNAPPAYWKTRHNAGWWLVDILSSSLGIEFRRPASQHWLLAEKRWDSHQFFLVKLLSYMNLNGKHLIPLLKKLKLTKEDLLIAVDQMDLMPGQIRLKFKGSNAGHNGLKSVESSLETTEYRRLYIGIGHPSNGSVMDHVLGAPSSDEAHRICSRLQELPPIFLEYFSQGWDVVINKINNTKIKRK